CFELATVNPGENLDQVRLDPETCDLFGIQKPVRSKTFELAAEKRLHGSDHLLGIVLADRDPDIHVLGWPDIAVVSDRMTTNQKIFNAVVVERPEEVVKIGAQ